LRERDAVSLLVSRFPALRETVDKDSLWTSPHIAYGLLATDLLEEGTTSSLNEVAQFVDELASSGDSLLEELLIVDLLEGIAQDANLARRLRAKIGPKSATLLERVEREFFGRNQ
jgi:hypothetical protein